MAFSIIQEKIIETLWPYPINTSNISINQPLLGRRLSLQVPSIFIRMVRFQTFLLASAASLPSFAYNVKVVGCDDRLRDAGENFITRMLEDSKVIAGAAVRSTLFGDDPPNKSPDENKKLEPL